MLREDEIAGVLLSLDERGLLRRLSELAGSGGQFTLGGRKFLNFSSNDYLNLACSEQSKTCAREAVAEWGVGATASRLVCGTSPVHTELERELAALKGYPAALVFGSGALANIGAMQALVERSDVVFADKLVHATMLDGLLLTRAKLLRFKHNDLDHLRSLLAREQGRRAGSTSFLIVTESVFSMDGDIAPLSRMCDLAADFDADLFVDEAHAFGVFGNCGAGVVAEFGLTNRVRFALGTLSKAVGSYGGFICSSLLSRELLINRARSFIYSTALPPASAAGALAGLAFLRTNPEAGRELLTRAEIFRGELRRAGLDVGASASQIVPVMVGEDSRAAVISRRLRDAGIIGVAIREPTVPRGTARIRLSVTLGHEEHELRRAAAVIAEVFHKELG